MLLGWEPNNSRLPGDAQGVIEELLHEGDPPTELEPKEDTMTWRYRGTSSRRIDTAMIMAVRSSMSWQ